MEVGPFIEAGIDVICTRQMWALRRMYVCNYIVIMRFRTTLRVRTVYDFLIEAGIKPEDARRYEKIFSENEIGTYMMLQIKIGDRLRITLRQKNSTLEEQRNEVIASAAQSNAKLNESLQQNRNLQQKIEQLTQKESEWIQKESEWIQKESKWIQEVIGGYIPGIRGNGAALHRSMELTNSNLNEIKEPERLKMLPVLVLENQGSFLFPSYKIQRNLVSNYVLYSMETKRKVGSIPEPQQSTVGTGKICQAQKWIFRATENLQPSYSIKVSFMNGEDEVTEEIDSRPFQYTPDFKKHRTPQSRSTKDTKSKELKSAMSKIRRDRVKIPTSLPIQQQCMKKLVRNECMREFFSKYADRLKQLENSPQA